MSNKNTTSQSPFHRIYVIYDGIANSVFVSQVLEPTMHELEANPSLHVSLISFELKQHTPSFLQKIIPAHDRLDVIIARRIPFFSKHTLWLAVYQLKKILPILNGNEYWGRGPLAGWIILKSLEWFTKKNPIPASFLPHLCIQARGLCAEEYRYVQHFKKNKTPSFIRRFIYNQLFTVEREVFGYRGIFRAIGHLFFEVVSPALMTYLHRTFGTAEQDMTLAQRDLPIPPDQNVRKQWREQLRKELNIPLNATVYIYSGSFKPWQCAEETIELARTYLEQSSSSYFIILSPDTTLFRQALNQFSVESKRCRVLSVSPDQLMRYLSIGDYGFLLRKKDIINWVSRPTKMLEYQAAGLKIIHNETIALLAKHQE